MGDQRKKKYAKDANYEPIVLRVFFTVFFFLLLWFQFFLSMPIFILYAVTVFKLFHLVIEGYKLPLKNVQGLTNNLAFSLQF